MVWVHAITSPDTAVPVSEEPFLFSPFHHAAGCRGLSVGGAKVSEKHCNFLINEDGASGADLEELGETVRARVKDASGIELEWEIRRLGVAANGKYREGES